MVLHWQTPYLGARFLPKQLSGWEIDHFFTLEPEERDDLCRRFSGLNRLAMALQLGFLRMTGCTLDGVRILPRNLLEHIGAQLAIDTPHDCLGTRTLSTYPNPLRSSAMGDGASWLRHPGTGPAEDPG
jgi:hypothetical protein